jgi:hypothetical protein
MDLIICVRRGVSSLLCHETAGMVFPLKILPPDPMAPMALGATMVFGGAEPTPEA